MVSPKELLAHAEQLLHSGKGELDYRNAVVNAYYAAYHAAAAFEESLSPRSPADTSGPGSHDALIQRLERPHGELEYFLGIVCKEMGAALRMLKALREHASYELGRTVRVDHAEEAIGSATEILAEISKAMAKARR